MNNLPLVSISCITYNHANYIRQCLDGFFNQITNFEFEIILHDDASTDGTDIIVKEYQEKYPNVLKPIFQTKNQYSLGKKPAWEFNAPRWRGKYIAVCEGDDFWTDPLKLQKQVDYLEAHPECVMAYHDARMVDESGDLLQAWKVPAGLRKDHTSKELQEGDSFILSLSILFRNVPILTAMPIEHSKVMNADNFLTSLLGAYGSGHYMAEVEPAVYRVHGGGIWSSQNEGSRKLTQMNTWMWMGAYYDRIGRVDLAEYFFERVNKRIKPMSEFHQLRHRKAYQWFVRVMGWLRVSFPK